MSLRFAFALLSLAFSNGPFVNIAASSAIRMISHDLCRLGLGVTGSCSGEAGCGNRRSGHRIFLVHEARLKLGHWAIRSSTNRNPTIVGGRKSAC
jgi:hypothetical protein